MSSRIPGLLAPFGVLLVMSCDEERALEPIDASLGAPPANTALPPETMVSVIALLGRPSEFEKKSVSAVGYLGPNNRLFVSKEHARAEVVEYGVRLHFGGCDGGLGLAPKVRSESISHLVGGYVWVKGTFVKSGRLGTGMLCEIVEVHENVSVLPP